MAAPVVLLEATPRQATDGAAVTVRLAGGGADRPYHYGGEHWRAGLTGLPRSVASLDFDGEQLGGGGVAQALELRWGASDAAQLAELAQLYWGDAPVTVRVGPEGDALPPVTTTGLVQETAVEGGQLRIALADQAQDLKRPLLVDRFAGTGGAEGPAEWDGRIKSRAWGRCVNVPGACIDKVHNIWCFGDPGRPWQAFDQVRDLGIAADAGDLTLLAWQGSVAATFAALQAATAAEGGGVLAPSIASLQWWTTAAGDLHADIRGETAGGYVETAAEIAQRIVAARSTLSFASGAVAAATSARPAAFGWRVDSESGMAAAVLSELLAGVSLSWLIVDGAVEFRRWEWTASTRAARSEGVSRRKAFAPVATRKLGYRRNWGPMTRGELSSLVLSGDYQPPLTPQGAYDGATVYADGDLVLQAGSTWLYINAAPSAGHAPPTLPTTENAYWRVFAAAGGAGAAGAGTFTLIAGARVSITPTSVTKIDGGGDWNAGAYSAEGFAGDVMVIARIPETASAMMIGLNSDPATDDDYATIDYAMYAARGSFLVFESGNSAGGFGYYNAGDFVYVRRRGTSMEYGVLGETSPRFTRDGVSAATKLFLDSSLFDLGSSLTNLSIQPAGSDGTDGKDGDDGAPGLNNATALIFKRAATPPALPTASTTYTFGTGVSGLTNGWSATVPSGTDPLWVSIATASSTGSTDTIAAGEWASPVVQAQNGLDGSAGLNAKSLFIYKRATSSPSLPSVSATYTFSTQVLSGLNNGWTATIPTGTDPIYVSTASALSITDTDTIASGEWAAVALLAQNGAAGADAVVASLSTNSVSVAADSSNVTKAGQLPRGVTLTVRQGSTEITSGATVTLTPSTTSITAGYASGAISITAADASGYIDVAVSLGSTSLGSLRIQVPRTQDAPPPASQTSDGRDLTFDTSNTSYAGASSDTVVLKANGSGQLICTGGGEYYAEGATSSAGKTFTMRACFAYRAAGGGGWSYTSEVTGSQANTPKTTLPDDPTLGSFTLSNTLTGLTAGASYEVGVAARKSTGTAASALMQSGSFTVHQ